MYQDATLIRLLGKDIKIDGIEYTLTQVLSEKCYPEYGERIGVFAAQRKSDLEEVIVKMHIQRHPAGLPSPDEGEELADWTKHTFNGQVQALNDCGDISPARTPAVLGHEERGQPDDFEYKGGYLGLLVMTKLPGHCLLSYSDLSDSEVCDIKRQLVQLCEDLRIRGWEYSQATPENVLYDRETGRIYLVGFAHAEKRDLSEMKPIDRDSVVMWEFGLNVWRF